MTARPLSKVLSALGLEAYEEALQANWETSRQTFPEGQPFFLDTAFIRETARSVGIGTEIAHAAVQASKQVEKSQSLQALLWHFYRCVLDDAYPRGRMGRWPNFSETFGEQEALYYVLVLLACVPHMQRIHQDRSIPSAVIQETVEDFERKIVDYRSRKGFLGLDPGPFRFLVHHLRGRLYQLGRLQYVPGGFTNTLHVYRHKRSGVVLALSEDGIKYTQNGELDFAGRIDPGSTSFTASLDAEETHVVGNPVTPRGKALPSRVSLPLRDWRLVLVPGDPVLELHIPIGSPMAYHQCGDSFARALQFFPRYFPDRPFKAFCCNSWLLDNQLEDMLSESSNLVRFLREMYRFPVKGTKETALRWIFGVPPKDLTKAPRNTTLRRKILDHFLSGGDWYSGGCFLLKEDFNWGSQVYRSQTWPLPDTKEENHAS